MIMTEKRDSHEAALLSFVEGFSKEFGYPPSTREIALQLGFKSVESVHRLLVHLKNAGKVTWVPNRARTLRILNSPPVSTD